MSEALRLSFDVNCPVEHAFDVWTARMGTWWPADHTVSGDPATIVLQPGVGGRIYERSRDGVEHDWGVVTDWSPPRRLAYLWHIGRDRVHATEVEITFTARDDATSRIDIEHRGWDRLGANADLWRDRNEVGWTALLPHAITAMSTHTREGDT